nr:hypothetical protein HmN_000155000 [Hymenolepis microstoma]
MQKRSSGEVNIHPECQIKMEPKAKEILLTLFNKKWETSLVPTQWEVAIVIPMLKNGKDPSKFDTYRPISLISILAKLMERMVKTKLAWFLEINNILGNEQVGFRSQRSTNQQVVTLSQHIEDALDARNTLTAVFIDFESNELKPRTKEKQWTAALFNIADWPRLEAVAELRLCIGHKCLAKHLHIIGVCAQPTCPLCDLQEEMKKTHSIRCPALQTTKETQRYWEARSQQVG